MEQKFYICEHCGNIIAMVKDSGVPVMCCGQKMKEIIPGTVDAAVEKHVPMYRTEGNLVKVSVGAVEHAAGVKVTYQIDTGYSLERTVPDREDAIAAAPPATLEGYTFVGWRQDDQAEKKVLSEFIISSEEPVTLYAVFKKQMTIGLMPNGGTLAENVAQCFRAIIEDREPPEHERIIDGYGGFLFTDKNGYPEVAMHWEHRFKHMLNRYNEIYRVQMPKITPHVCRHTYCSNMAKAGMNPKTLQYLMGHSDIGVTLNTYTHLGLEDAEGELKRMEGLEDARKELDKAKGEKPVSQKMFRAI